VQFALGIHPAFNDLDAIKIGTDRVLIKAATRKVGALPFGALPSDLSIFSLSASPGVRPGEFPANAGAVNNAAHKAESVNMPALVLMVLVLMVLVLMVLVLMVLVLMVLVLMILTLALMGQHEDQGQSAYFFAAFSASGVYQMGDDQASS
jgi:hypothetical protein